MENTGDIIIYQTDDGLTKIDVKLDHDTVWLNQQQMVLLFHSSKSNISEHIKHIFAEGELEEDSVVRKFRTTADDGKKNPSCFSRWYKTNCIMLPMDIPQLRSSIIVPMQTNPSWVSLPFRVNCPH